MVLKENKYFILDCPEKINCKYVVRYMLAVICSLGYKGLMNIIYPKTIEKRYKVAICAIFRDEARYLKEWIEYHLVVGIEHFYLYNNFSKDSYMEILQPYIDKNIVTLIEWPVNLGQFPAYRDCISRFSEEAKWIGFVDLDEFVVPNEVDSIYDFLKKFEKNRASVLIYWKNFGTSGIVDREENRLVIQDFKVCWKKHTDIGKCFFNTKYKFDADSKRNKVFHHWLWGNYKGINFPPVNFDDKPVVLGINRIHTSEFPIQINHYLLKSYKEYWNRKSKKGGGTHDVGMHDINYFYEHENKCQSVDFHIYKFIIRLRERLDLKQ